ncbi:astacin-like metalloendopeptidase [Varanus komodoensis]|uniref:astacin-like metalloendopeptidase n=1 Tax=Varanus komodoensis TaxID=61221 RepID=UPI001CF7689F|nr:astacin-like metalloendopeptidase [Varanus komodoensis]
MNEADGQQTDSSHQAAKQGIQRKNDPGEANSRQDDIVHRRTPRSAVSCNQSCYWPRSENGAVSIPVNISTEFSLEQRLVIAEAMQEFVTLTCIRFVSRTTEHDYIDIVPGDKCWSYFGRIGGRQHLGLLKPGCIYKGLIQHELNHALGFLHEQTRSDRDDYVKINLEYVAAGEQGNFAKVNSTNLGLPYDYSSVMHYGAYDFSNTAGKATIVPVPNASVPIGQRAGLSNLDVKKINKLYSCNNCSTVLSSPTGKFSSDNFPHAYPNNVSCLWLIRIPEKKVFLSFHVMDLQPSPNCASDYIRVYDGISRNARVLVDNFCEAGTLPAVVASGSMLLVEFVSDEDTSAAGFSASYTHVKCGGTFTDMSGAVISPNFPGRYPANQACLWIISAPGGSRISLTMAFFELEDVAGCRYDRLVLHDGSQNSSPLIGTFCGNTDIPPFNSTGSFLRIEFYTDIAFEYSGFRLDYSIS